VIEAGTTEFLVARLPQKNLGKKRVQLAEPVADNILIVFVKYPKPGLVKTRLAKSIGKDKATLFYRLFVEAVLRRTEDKNFKRIIFYTPAEKEKEFKKWLGRNEALYPQKGINLGERLSYAFKFAFQRQAKRVIAIGTDSPLIENKIINRGFQELKNKPCVIGPSKDGGYYLIGLSGLYKKIFKDIEWGTHLVISQTFEAMKKLKLKFGILKEELDVDALEDLIALRNILKKRKSTKITEFKRILELINIVMQ
jgi:rSAM/selenodomain-associated transferase 1